MKSAGIRMFAAGLLLGACLTGCAANGRQGSWGANQTAPAANDRLFDELALYDYGQSRAALQKIQAEIDTAPRDQYAMYEGRLLIVLRSPQAAPAAKDFASRMLLRVGSDKCVATLGTMVSDERNSLSARRVLEVLPGEAATVALVGALPEKPGKVRIGAITSLGQRRDPKVIDLLCTYITDSDPAVGQAAAIAVGHIGTVEAAAALQAVRPKVDPVLAQVIDRARLDAADQVDQAGKKDKALVIFDAVAGESPEPGIRAAAFRGALCLRPATAAAKLVVTAMGEYDLQRRRMALQVLDDPASAALRVAVVEKLATTGPTLPADRQLALLGILGDHAEYDLRPVLVSLQRSADVDVRAAAVTGLAKFGTREDVASLVGIAAGDQGADSDAARRSLVQISAKGIGEALATVAATGSEPERIVAIEVLGKRGDAAAMPALVKLIGVSDDPVAIAAAAVVGRWGTMRELPALTGLAARGPDAAVSEAAAEAAAQICQRTGDKAACEKQVLGMVKGGSPDAIPAGVLAILPALGTDRALAALRMALTSKDGEVRDAAARALSDWPTMAAATDLLELAKSESNETLRALALRGYIQLVRQSAAPDDRRVAMLREAWAVAPRAEERKQILAALGTMPCAAAIAMATPLLDDPEINAEAATTLVQLAAGLMTSDRARAEATFAALTARSDLSPDMRQRIADAREGVKSAEGYISQWLLAGPYEQSGADGHALFDIPLGPEKPGAKIAWRRVAISGDHRWPNAVDLHAMMPQDNCVAYLKVTINSDKAQSALLLLNSDDGVKAWLNGTLVHANNATRPVTGNPDKVSITLKAGNNSLLLKINQGTGEWGAAAKLTAGDGKAIEGVSTTADPDGP